ncbi:hypothetical protein MMC16_002976 [Acarospora aff. strigata]|nr:hypothetical protein [Acarospora aff. strigata]
MYLFKITSISLLAGLSIASPLAKRANITVVDDNTALNYILSLVSLAYQLQVSSLNKWPTGILQAAVASTFHDNFEIIYEEDQEQIIFLVDLLNAKGVTPVRPSTYVFGVRDIKFFSTLLSVLEGVGLSAYLSATTSISDKAGLTALGAILAVQALYSSYIRAAIGDSPFATAFDTPIDFSEANTLISVFIVDTPPGNPKFPFQGRPILRNFQGAFTTAKETDPTITASTPVYAVFLSGP